MIDEATVVAMLVAILSCPPDKRVDSMAAVIKLFVEEIHP